MKKTLKVPQHIAVIMDGNRRWAKEHNLGIIDGHKHIADVILEPLIEYAARRGVRYMTFWAWSTENWRRNKREIQGIMNIFRNVMQRHWQRLHKKGVQIKIIGDIEAFPSDIQHSLKKVVKETQYNTKITAVFALNYGGRDELIRAIQRYIEHQQFNNSTIQQLSNDLFSEFLDTAGIPDPDLIIRTGGEQRLSGFLLWQNEYSELYFPSWYMPEFTPDKLDEVIRVFQQRKRRFGA